jgi:hypothetical protein
MPDLVEWNSFYVIVGSAAAALIGLQFVALTLIANRPLPGISEASTAFSTPTSVHFGVVLLLSAIASIPWRTIGSISIVWGLVGFSGIAYAIVILRRMRIQKVYQPVFEDWLFHCLLPVLAYAMLAVSAFIAPRNARPALFVVAATTLLFLFIGIHNSWDGVTYHILTRRFEQPNTEPVVDKSRKPNAARQHK